ncbi:MAG: wax ester/triacylglycerol synthase family O-acyltransferase [Acidimicrobiales bacterium]
MSDTDAFTLGLERDPGLRATIVAVASLDRSPDWGRLVERIDRATRIVPAFRQRLVASPLGLATPRWVTDPDFDLAWHLRRVAVPPGGGMADVLEIARTASMAAFDPERPRWEFTLVEGLEGGAAALVLKVHHALTDGVGGVQIAALVVDLERGSDLGPLPPVPPDEARPLRGAGRGPRPRRRPDRAGAQRLAVGVPLAALRALRRPFASASGFVADARSLARMVRPISDTRSPVMDERSLVRELDRIDLPMEDLRAAGRRIGGTVNDAFVGGIAGGLRRYHEHHGRPVDALRVTMPISVRTDDDDVGGNRITLVRFDLPIGETDPQERMWQIHEACRRQRSEPAIARSEGIAAALNLLPVAVTGGMLRHVDLLASNVPGLDGSVYLAGARVDSFHPFGATLGSAANITLMSYADTACIGVTLDTAAVPDRSVFLRCLRAGFAELLA